MHISRCIMMHYLQIFLVRVILDWSLFLQSLNRLLKAAVSPCWVTLVMGVWTGYPFFPMNPWAFFSASLLSAKLADLPTQHQMPKDPWSTM